MCPARGRARALREQHRFRARAHAALHRRLGRHPRVHSGCSRTSSAAAAGGGGFGRYVQRLLPQQFGAIGRRGLSARAINRVQPVADPDRGRRGDLQPPHRPFASNWLGSCSPAPWPWPTCRRPGASPCNGYLGVDGSPTTRGASSRIPTGAGDFGVFPPMRSLAPSRPSLLERAAADLPGLETHPRARRPRAALAGSASTSGTSAAGSPPAGHWSARPAADSTRSPTCATCAGRVAALSSLDWLHAEGRVPGLKLAAPAGGAGLARGQSLDDDRRAAADVPGRRGRAADVDASLPCAHCGGAFHEPLTMAAKPASPRPPRRDRGLRALRGRRTDPGAGRGRSERVPPQ